MEALEIAETVCGDIITCWQGKGCEVKYAFSSDLMSDVLTREYEHTVLVTGLSHIQAIRTAELSDIGMIIFARDKGVGQEMVKMADQRNIVLLKSSFSIFKISGLLYKAGIKPIF